MILLAMLAAQAAPLQAYQSCCASVGATCPETVQVMGPDTTVTPVSSGTALKGLWSLSCGQGAFFDAAATASAGFNIRDGTVLSTISPQAAACFDAACAVPQDLCLQHEGDKARVVACGTRSAGTADMWRAPPRATTMPVLLRGRILKGVVLHLPGPGTNTARTGAVASTPSAVVTGVPAQPTVAVDLSVPSDPPTPCIPNNAMRGASNGQVDEGNEAMLRADLATALDKYRAAITIMECNAFAWAALGDTFIQLNKPGHAQQSLAVATRLMPSHYQAWSNLGLSLERLGQSDRAREAFQRSLELKPAYPPASKGLARLGP